ncbi:MAG: LamG domain-containing protein [Myxococcota bacterium]|nr:LamG domain-containing protein [Myxococcota bacterium]
MSLPHPLRYSSLLVILGALLSACMASYDVDGIRARDVSLDSTAELSDVSEDSELDEVQHELDEEDKHDPVDTSDEEVTPQRSREGLLALYSFRNGSGRVVENEVSPGTLALESEQDFEWLPEQGIRFDGSGGQRVCNQDQPSHFIEAIQQSNAFTLELWLRSQNDVRAGDHPARFVSNATGWRQNEFNIEVTQFNAELGLRWRGADGQTHDAGPITAFDGALHHIVIRQGTSNMELWLDGGRIESQSFGGPSSWSNSHPLCFGAAIYGSDWRGELFLVAIYARALSDEDIALHFQLGSGAD